MKIAFFLLTAYFFSAISLEPFQITEDARKFLDNHEISYVKKKNNVIFFNQDDMFEYRTVVENCGQIMLKKNQLIINYSKGQIKFAFDGKEFLRYHRKNESENWEGYRLRLDPRALTNKNTSYFMFETNLEEFQYRMLESAAENLSDIQK
ncbi:hypothetical protein [Chondrinema litorale]|uniref:hypothetical protein n=1 Tax=Chondrinema litorale TaxID=2994555 RepID=UPI0025429596|nr:hypothetical protein [Chondrinema litorale]UZR93231.1 hypothetical protein OQ292_15335 [Chondrinema litorale]